MSTDAEPGEVTRAAVNARVVASMFATGIWALVLGVVIAYEAAFSAVLFDGVSTEEMDGGNKAAYGFLFLLAIPVCVTACLIVCFWLRHRFRWLTLLLPLLPLAAWAIVLVVRFQTGDCGNALSRC